MSAPKYTIEYLIEQIEGADLNVLIDNHNGVWHVRANESWVDWGPSEWLVDVSAPTLREALEGAFDATRR